jgi:starch synthase
MKERRIRIAGVLVGDIVHEPFARVKYGLLFEALGRRFDLVDVHDVTLRGFSRLLNALLAFDTRLNVWREKFYKNVQAFHATSRRAAGRLHTVAAQADVSLQIGTLFDARRGGGVLPNVIYTDYTASLSAQRPDAGRSPFTSGHLQRWINCERQALVGAAHVCARSALVRASVCADYGVDPSRVSAIGGGVNLTLPITLSPRRAAGEVTAFFIGKDFYRKGGDLLLRAFASVRQTLPHARLVCLTGDFPRRDLPVGGVEFVSPTWERASIEALYRRADLFVLPARLETWGDVLLEAAAFGLPCIGVTGQPMQEIIEDGVTGCLVPPDDVPALAAAMVRLMRDDALRVRFGQAAAKRVASEYTWDHVAERLVPIVTRVVAMEKALTRGTV